MANALLQDPKTLEQRVAEIVTREIHRRPAGPVTCATNLVQDLGVDSLDVLGLVVALEEEYSITLFDEDLDRCTTVGDLAALVRRSL